MNEIEQQQMNFEKEEGIKNAYDHASLDWKLTTLKNLEAFCEQKEFLSVNDFREYNQTTSPNISTHDRRAMGGIMRVAVKNGWIKATDQIVDSTLLAHGQTLRIRVWKSLIYKREVIKI